MTNMQEASDLIRMGEEGMARRIALAYQISRPVSVWTAIIPGKFIFDAVKREREVAWAKSFYLPPRQEALQLAAQRVADDAEASAARGEDEGWPRERLVQRLAAHYERLLQVEGGSYAALIEAAYPKPMDLEAEWEAIEAIEEEVDEVACRNHPKAEALAARFEAYRNCAKEQRRRFIQEHYYE